MNAELLPCFICQKQGHWAASCPEKPIKRNGSSNCNNVQDDIPGKKCPCGAGTCVVLTSNTPRNPGRKFYKCPLYKSPVMKCNFFEWCDKATSDQRSEVPQPSNPKCPCGAGTCSRFMVKKDGQNKGRKFFTCPGKGASKCKFFHWCDVEMSSQSCEVQQPSYPECSCGAGKCQRLIENKDGENKGRTYFVCPVKKGQGACNFFQWEDGAGHDSNDDRLGEKEPFTSSQSTMDKEERNSYSVNNEDDDNIGEASSDEKQSESPSSVGCEVKEIVEVDVDDDALPTQMHNLSLREDKRAGIYTKPGNCFWCGQEGHGMKDCMKARSVCVKCGKFDHWTKDCTA